MQIPLFTLLLQGIPEMSAVALLAFIVAKADMSWQKIVLVGVGLALSAYVIRLLPITFGVHTVVLIGLLFISVVKLGGVSMINGILGSVSSFVALVIFETFSIMIMLNLLALSVEAVTQDPILRAVVGLPHVLMLFLTSLLLSKYWLRRKKRDAFF